MARLAAMTKESILSTIANTVLDVTGIAPELVTMDATFEKLDIDSLYMVTIFVELEKAYEINLDNMGQVKTVVELVDYIFEELHG